MTHYIGAVILPEPRTGKDLDSNLSEALAPFHEGLEVEIWTSRDDVIQEVRDDIESYRTSIYAEYQADPDAYAAKWFNTQHLAYLRDEFPQRLTWTDEECYAHGVEDHETRADGARLDTYNPQSKWDRWTVGGRWEEIYSGHQGETVAVFVGRLEQTKADLAAGINCNPHKGDPHAEGRELPWYFPHHLLTTDGTWREIGAAGWFGIRDRDQTEAEWVTTALEALAGENPNAVVYYVDYHI